MATSKHPKDFLKARFGKTFAEGGKQYKKKLEELYYGYRLKGKRMEGVAKEVEKLLANFDQRMELLESDYYDGLVDVITNTPRQRRHPPQTSVTITGMTNSSVTSADLSFSTATDQLSSLLTTTTSSISSDFTSESISSRAGEFAQDGRASVMSPSGLDRITEESASISQISDI